MNPDPYFNMPQCSNSDLSAVKELLMPKDFIFDYDDALRFGTLVDALITEMSSVNVYKRQVFDYIYKPEEFNLAYRMKQAFYKDQTCAFFMKLAECQKISVGNVKFNFNGFDFEMAMRCKWDLFMPRLNHGADIKSTTATTQQQFEDACEYFDYWRSRVVYMLLEDTQKDMLIGISKVNCKIFKIPIVRGDKYWQKGLASATDLAFKYFMNFDGFSPLVRVA